MIGAVVTSDLPATRGGRRIILDVHEPGRQPYRVVAYARGALISDAHNNEGDAVPARYYPTIGTAVLNYVQRRELDAMEARP